MPTQDSPPSKPIGLTSALEAAGTLRQGAIVTATITERIQTTVSNLWFLEVGYAPGSYPRLPTRLVLKWPLDDSVAPDRGAPEIVFYQQLAPALPTPPIVRCFATATRKTEHQWLMLEDLRSSYSNPPWPQLPNNQSVREAVSVLARLHAHWWEAPTLGSLVGTLHTESSLRTMVYGIAAHMAKFFDDLGQDLPSPDRLLIETVFNSSLQPWLRLVDRRALTVVHGDAHPWNFLFPRSEQGDPYLIDWQLWHLDVGPRDLAFLIALYWDPTVRQQLELPLLHVYHDELIKAGISSYSFDDLLLDYRRCVVRNLTYPLILWSRGLPRDAWRHRLDCALAAYRDLDCEELL